MKFSYAWLQTYFEGKLPSPAKIEEVIGLQAFEPEGMEKVDNDTILDFDVLPNRAHDCLCHEGLTREISTLFNLPRSTDRYKPIPQLVPTSDKPLLVDIQDQSRCRRYTGRVIEGVKIGPSPDWLKQRLEAIGQRSINNVVDATNYVMFDLGQPMHAFDYDKVSASQINVRSAQTDETITLLGGEEKTLQDQLVIADGTGVLAIAGVKGGQKAEVDQGTTTIVLEAANFEPVSTRKSSRGLKLHTDSSKRFENEITPAWTEPAIEACTRLIFEIAEGDNIKIGPIVDEYVTKPEFVSIDITVQRINRVLGLELTKVDIGSIFNLLGLHVTSDADTFTIGIPDHRLDLLIPEDLIEEVGRVHGYDNVPTVLPNNPAVVIHTETYYTHQIRNFLTSQGFHEVMTYTFTDHGEVEMANALASDKNFLRSNLHEGFRKSLESNTRNSELFGDDAVRIFEIGSVFTKDSETTNLVIGFGSTQKKAKFDLDQTITELSEYLGVELKATEHEGILEINLTQDLAAAATKDSYNLEQKPDQREFSAISSYPFILRDISVWLPAEVDPAELVDIITIASGELLVRTPRVFDKYEKEGRVSYAYRMVLQSQDRTLTDEDANKIMQKISHELDARGWEIR